MKNELSRREFSTGLAASLLTLRTVLVAQNTSPKTPSTSPSPQKTKKAGPSQCSIEERVKQIIVEQLGVNESEVVPTAKLVDLGSDSLDCVELVMAFEEAFDMEIPDEDAEKLKTIKDCIDYIKAHAKAKGCTSPAKKTPSKPSMPPKSS